MANPARIEVAAAFPDTAELSRMLEETGISVTMTNNEEYVPTDRINTEVAERDRLVAGDHNEPHRLLGAHPRAADEGQRRRA